MASEDIDCAYSASPFHFVDGAYLRDNNPAGLVGCFTPDLIFRNVMSFDVSVITPPVTITAAELRVTVSAVSGDPSAKTYKVNGYGTDGTGSPETDSDQELYDRAAGVNYVSGNTSLRTTGAKTINLLAAADDLDAAITAGGLFSIGIQETTENPATEHIVKPDGDGGTVAVLHIEYTAGDPEPEPPASGGPVLSSDGGRWGWR